MSFENRPHHKTATDHKPGCGCGSCRVWRRRRRSARVLDNLNKADREGGVRMGRTAEAPGAEERRIERSEKIRMRITEAIDTIMEEEGYIESVRRVAEDEFCAHAARVCGPSNYEGKAWAGKGHAQRKRGAISSLQVLLGNHAAFRDQKGRLQEAKGNLDWVLDCWERALEEFEGSRQMRLV